MVDRKHRRPHITGVTVFANVGRLHVRGAFTRSVGAVVATEAVAGDIHVIEVRR